MVHSSPKMQNLELVNLKCVTYTQPILGYKASGQLSQSGLKLMFFIILAPTHMEKHKVLQLLLAVAKRNSQKKPCGGWWILFFSTVRPARLDGRGWCSGQMACPSDPTWYTVPSFHGWANLLAYMISDLRLMIFNLHCYDESFFCYLSSKHRPEILPPWKSTKRIQVHPNM